MVLFVDPDRAFFEVLQRALPLTTTVKACTDFYTARELLFEWEPDLLVTNIRLSAFNGLQLVYLAKAEDFETRSVVYARPHDIALAHEIQIAGAFYEPQWRLPYAIATYVRSVLPPSDRRDPAIVDRRRLFRGGRRCTDRPFLFRSQGEPGSPA